MSIHLTNYTIFSLILTPFLVINLFLWNNPYIGFILGFVYLFLLSFILGKVIFYGKSLFFQILYGLLFLISGISFFGAIIYYFHAINNLVISILIITAPLALLPITIWSKNNFRSKEISPIKITSGLLLNSFLAALFILLEIINFRLILDLSTAEAIRTPWNILPFKFFILFFLTSLVLIIFIIKNKNQLFSLFLTSIHAFFIVSVVLFFYKIGYGFDPFIHEATQKVIFKEGFILPKPLYYLGQYSLVVFLAKILFIPIEIINKFLVPFLIAIFIPTTIYSVFRQTLFTGNDLLKKSLSPILACITIFILPFTSFINTTPQGLANFFLILIILLSVLALKKEFSIKLLWFLAFTTFLIHPLAGLPAFIFVFLLSIVTIPTSFKVIKGTILALSTILTTAAIPLFFFLASFVLHAGEKDVASIKFPDNISLFFNEINWSWPTLINHFNPLLDLIYTYGKNIPYVLLLTAFVGLLFTRKKIPNAIIYPITFTSLVINYILLKNFITFPALIEYEQGAYSDRILEMSFYFLIPLFLFFTYRIFQKALKSSFLVKSFFILTLALFLTFSLYYSYPKDDGEDYHIDRGYSVSEADINAVHKIQEDASNQDYIVLANQSVSAAAIREFGFAKYYGPHFYYPVPTGDPLYQYYLKMVYEAPSRRTIEEAAELTGVSTVYFVLNDYWTDAKTISEETKKNADQTFLINNKVNIFKYEL